MFYFIVITYDIIQKNNHCKHWIVFEIEHLPKFMSIIIYYLCPLSINIDSKNVVKLYGNNGWCTQLARNNIFHESV